MDYFYHADAQENLTLGPNFFEKPAQNLDPAIYLKVTSLLFVRAGLFLSHVSSIPSSNIQILIFQNIIDISINTVIYALIGYLFAFGKDVGDFIGTEGFLGDNSNRNEFVEGWLIVIAVSGLLVAAIGDRISFFASLVINTLTSGLVLPIFIHWILSDSGWMRVNTLAKVRVSYKDYSYSCLIHMSGGFLAFISMLILNKRLLRFKDMDVCSIPDNGPSLTLFGNFFMLIGFFGIGVPTEKYILSHLDYNFYGIVLVNMLLSAFGSVTSVLLLTFSCPCEPMHKWTSMRSVQAGISGIAVVAAGADIYYPMAALLVGLFIGIVFFFASFLVSSSPIEDYSNIIACHFASGFIGTLLPPIFGIREGFAVSLYYNFMHFTWQFLCDLAVMGFMLSIFVPIMLVLDYCSALRSWDEDINHRRAIFASRTIKTGNKIVGSVEGKKQTVQYAHQSYEEKKSVPQREFKNTVKEGVNVLFEKKSCPNPLNAIEETLDDSFENYTISSWSKEKPIELCEKEKIQFVNDEFVVNYMVNSKPLTFFEEVNPGSRHISESAFKGCGDSLKNPRFFDIRLIKGIRNISDSKLFQKFKDNWTVPKKRTVWNKERQLKFGSMSNIWVPNLAGINIETQV